RRSSIASASGPCLATHSNRALETGESVGGLTPSSALDVFSCALGRKQNGSAIAISTFLPLTVRLEAKISRRRRFSGGRAETYSVSGAFASWRHFRRNCVPRA